MLHTLSCFIFALERPFFLNISNTAVCTSTTADSGPVCKIRSYSSGQKSRLNHGHLPPDIILASFIYTISCKNRPVGTKLWLWSPVCRLYFFSVGIGVAGCYDCSFSLCLEYAKRITKLPRVINNV